MSKWRTVRLGDVATYINGYAFKPSEWSDSGLPIIRIQDLTGNNYETNFYNGEYNKKYEINNGDVLISWSASLGVYEWNRGLALLNQHIFKVQFDKIDIDKRFFIHAVTYLLQGMLKDTHGSTMKHITKPRFDNTLFPYPDIEMQVKIAQHLDLVKDQIKICNAIIDKLDLSIKARFVEMFGDFNINPMNWPIVGFDDIAIIEGNMTTNFDKYADYPHIGIDSIQKDTGLLLEYRTVAEDGVTSGKYVFTPAHVIYSKIRPNLNKVALPDFEGLCSADAYPILPIEGKCNRIFLAYNMRSPFFLDYILKFCNRTNLPKVNRKEVRGFRTPLPPIELQEKFADFVFCINKSKALIQSILDKLNTLRASLMQEYFG